MQDDIKRRLLGVARQSITAEVHCQGHPAVDAGAWPDLAHAGAFVTLRTRGRLRGCIGTFKPLGCLAATVGEMSAAACHDPRFTDCPVTGEELPNLRIEISVLSPLVRTDDPCSLALGKHGIYVRRGHSVGCFLPQVATEQGWDVETFLSQCCQYKAGLPRYAWHDRDTEVYLFTTECFCECEMAERARGEDGAAGE